MFVSRFANALRRSASRSAIKNDDGVTAIEFAMIAPLFFLLMGSLMETGLMLFTEYLVQTSVQDSARLVRTGQAQEDGLSAADFKTEICNLATVINNCSTKVTVHLVAADSFTELSGIVPSYLSIGNAYGGGGGENDNYDCGAAGQAMALIATYDWEFIMPFLKEHFGNVDGDTKRRLAGVYLFQNEPFPATGTCGA